MDIFAYFLAEPSPASKFSVFIRVNQRFHRKFLLLIDGIDEAKPNNTDLSKRLLSLIEQTRDEKNVKLVIASRNITNEEIESNEIFRKNRYQIKPLKLNGMIKFLESLCKGINIQTRLIEDLKQSDLFKVLPKTPIAAIILAKLLSEGSEELPMNLTELYSKYCELSLGRWDIDKGLQTQREFEALDVLVSLIAEYMLNNEIPSLSKKEAKEIFKEYLSERNLSLDHDSLFENMLERSGILVEDKLNSTISFKHRSFAEFFFAKNLRSKQNITIDEKIFHPYWTNSYFFYVGLKRDCPDLLESIIDIPVKHEGHRISRIINLGNLLLAGYQSPTKIINKGISSIFKDAGDYYIEIFENKTESFLGKLPPMHLLSLMTSMIEDGYNYKFFEKPIDNAIEDFATSPENSNGKVYTLFFLDLMRYKLGGPALFERIIDLYGDKLPTTIQLAIGHESELLKYDSSAIKKIQKRLRKHGKSKPFRDGIVRLYEESSDGMLKISSDGKRK